MHSLGIRDLSNILQLKQLQIRILCVCYKTWVGADCSSLAELILCEKVGITGHDIMFTSNDTPYVEYKRHLKWVQSSILMILHISNI